MPTRTTTRRCTVPRSIPTARWPGGSGGSGSPSSGFSATSPVATSWSSAAVRHSGPSSSCGPARAPVGLDLSHRQLAHARSSIAGRGLSLPLTLADGEHVPVSRRELRRRVLRPRRDGFLRPRRDPSRSVTGVAVRGAPGVLDRHTAAVRNLRRTARTTDEETPITHVRSASGAPAAARSITRSSRVNGSRCSAPTASWSKTSSSFDHRRAPPPPTSTTPYEWARRWPAEQIWRVRKERCREASTPK